MGTTAQKLQAILDSKADIASAIEEKGGTVPTKLSDYGDAIRALPSGPEEPADVEFIDYDGTVLYKYTFAEANALTELPPYHDRECETGWIGNLIATLDDPSISIRFNADFRTLFNTANSAQFIAIVGETEYSCTAPLYNRDTGGTAPRSVYGPITGWGSNYYVSVGEIITGGRRKTVVVRQGSDGSALYSGFTLSTAKIPYTNEGWNYTLAEIKSNAQAGIKTTVGCTYTASDGATRIHVHIEGSTADDRKFGFTMAQKTTAKVHISWGDPDDTSDDQTPGTTNHLMRYHTYSEAGDFTITLSPVVAGEKMLRFQKNICDYNIKYCEKITGVELGLLDQFYGSTARGGPLAFCDDVEHFSIPSTITDSEKGGTASCMNMRTLKALVLPRSSSSYPIKAYFFKNCSSIEKVSIPPSVYQIGTNIDSTANGSSFINCVGLKYLAVPSSVIDIGKNTFDSCSSLRRVYWYGAQKIHAYSFNRCTSLEEINLHDDFGNVQSVGGSDFYGCDSLKRVTCSTPIEATGESCFQNCVSLESVPELYSVSGNMFNGCVSLGRVKVTTSSAIGRGAFRYSGLIELDMSGCTSIPSLGGNALDSVPDDLVIIVPNGQLSAWQQATGWSSFASKMVEATT